MEESQKSQLDLNYSLTNQDGYSAWQRQRKEAAAVLARSLGLPLERNVEVRLKDGIVLQGILRMKEELLFFDAVTDRNLELRVGPVGFRPQDIESCVRI